MPRKKTPEDLTVEELRQLLVEKRRASRQDRLDHFRRTGRIITLATDLETDSLEGLVSNPLSDSVVLDDSGPRVKHRRVFDGLLLFIEILAVIGLIFVLFNGLDIIRQLNQEVAEALDQPTLTPTPLVRAVILPSGHTPPNIDGVTRPNEAEIPEHLRPLVQSLADIPIPTPGPSQANRIQIPEIGVDAPIVQGDGWEQLKKGVGQHIGTVNPGDDGNIVLSAHNDIFGEIFRHLDQLQNGDEIILYTNQKAYTYVITRKIVVEPTEVSLMDPTPEPVVTLISCYPYLIDDQRIVVQGLLKTTDG